VAHYFGDKDGLLEAPSVRSLRALAARRCAARLALARTPRGRVQAVIDTNLAPEEFDKRSGTAWLAFWGQVLHVKGLKRVQTASTNAACYRTCATRSISFCRWEEARSLAYMIAAMIDGVWLRAALSEWTEADSESARALLTAFVEGRLRQWRKPSRHHAGGPANASRARQPAGTFTTSSIRPPVRFSRASELTGTRG
jgi:betaine-aldehyde dehydrogenase